MKQFCLRGHDTFVVGRDKGRHCVACDNERVARYKAKHPESVAASRRRLYIRNRETEIEAAHRWNVAHHDRRLENNRRSKAKYRGVNFWVEAAAKSR